MQRRNNIYRSSRFVGVECGTIIPLPRMNRQREKGHIKDLWCPVCGKKHGFREYKGNEFIMTMSEAENLEHAGCV